MRFLLRSAAFSLALLSWQASGQTPAPAAAKKATPTQATASASKPAAQPTSYWPCRLEDECATKTALPAPPADNTMCSTAKDAPEPEKCLSFTGYYLQLTDQHWPYWTATISADNRKITIDDPKNLLVCFVTTIGANNGFTFTCVTRKSIQDAPVILQGK